MALTSLILATIVSTLKAHTHEFTYNISATVTDLTILGQTVESVEYDKDHKVYYFISRPDGRIGTISGAYPGSSDDADFTVDAFPDADSTNSTNGLVYFDEILYIANIDTGYVMSFDVHGGTSFTNIAYIGSGVNGLCQDPDDTNMLYATNVGLNFFTGVSTPSDAGLWSIDTDTNTVTRLYAGNDTSWDDGYVFQPNGCTVRDSVVYMVESQFDRTGSLGMYDIDSGDMSYSTEKLTVSGDGLVSTDDYLFMTYWTATSGELMSLDMNNDSAVFKSLVDGMVAPADICVNEDEHMIAIPGLFTGEIHFVEYDDGDDDDGDFANSYSLAGVMVAIIASVLSV